VPRLDQPDGLQLELLRVLPTHLLVIHLVAPVSDFIISQELRPSGARSLVRQGIDLEPPRKVRLKLSVPAGVTADRASESLRADGYVVEALAASTQPLCARQVIQLHGDDLQVRGRYINELAAAAGGQYLGWELLDRSPIGRGAIASG
jgi:hypothetical protein